MVFRIDYMDGRPPREVTEAHFQGSRAFYPVLLLEVGGTKRGYQSAGYRLITRTA